MRPRRLPGRWWRGASDADGQLGNGAGRRPHHRGRRDGLTGVIQMDGGREHVVALKQNGTVWAWGHNNDGQVGDGTKINRPGTGPGQGAHRA